MTENTENRASKRSPHASTDKTEPAPKGPTPVSGLPPDAPAETDGPKGPEPTRYGDWEVGGRCSDF